MYSLYIKTVLCYLFVIVLVYILLGNIIKNNYLILFWNTLENVISTHFGHQTIFSIIFDFVYTS